MTEASREPLTYTVTPGPEVKKKMGQSWVLFNARGAVLATFSRGKDGLQAPAPATLSLTEAEAAELAAAGYAVQALSGVWPASDGDAGPGIDPIGLPKPAGGQEDGAVLPDVPAVPPAGEVVSPPRVGPGDQELRSLEPGAEEFVSGEARRVAHEQEELARENMVTGEGKPKSRRT